MAIIRNTKTELEQTLYTADSPEVLDAYQDAVTGGAHLNLLLEQTKLNLNKSPGFLRRLWEIKMSAPRGPDQVQIRVFQPQPRTGKNYRMQWPASLHAKQGVSDNRIAWVGSQNMTENASTWFESGVIYRDAEAISAQREVFASWFTRYGKPLTEAMIPREHAVRSKSSSAARPV